MRRERDQITSPGTMTRRDAARLLSGGAAETLGWSALAPARPTAWTPTAYAQEAARAQRGATTPLLCRLSSNENNYGLAPAALAALTVDKVVAQACRYGGEASSQLTQALAKANGVPAESVMLAAGSGEILRAVTLAFTGPDKPLVLASPTFEAPGRTAETTKAVLTQRSRSPHRDCTTSRRWLLYRRAPAWRSSATPTIRLAASTPTWRSPLLSLPSVLLRPTATSS